MSTATTVSISEYLDTIYRPDCDYLDGEILERNVGELEHSRLQTLLSIFLGIREKQWDIIVLTEQRVQVKAARFRVPDISILTGAMPDGPILKSPRDRMQEMQGRIDDYLAFGVRYVWVIHPRSSRGS
jgi:Uma2 family endonuclease